MINYARKSLNGLWVGDCIGNLGTLYNVGDILKALDAGIKQYGSQLDKFQHQFQLSDDTEESIVLYDHLVVNKGRIDQDKLAMEFATRYYERDKDGEIFGYGLMTRKVLREIYDGKPWREANQTKPRIEGPSFVDKLVAGVAEGKSLTDSMAVINADLKKQMAREPEMKVGSCGNGSAMRVAPLGAYFANDTYEKVVEQATLQAEVTHCHSEGIAGSIAVAILAREITKVATETNPPIQRNLSHYYSVLLHYVPKGQVYNGIVRASNLLFDTPLTKLMEVLGNGTHVTCQDTVPLCIFLTIRALCNYNIEEMYEKVIIETCKCFGDVDTNCAIVGGMIGIISPPPKKWEGYCQPMEGVLGEEFPDKPRKPIQSKLGFDVDKEELKNVMKNIRPSGLGDGLVEDQAASLYETAVVMSDALRKPQPTFEEVLAARKKELGL